MLNPNHPRYRTKERVRGWTVPVDALTVPRLLKRRVSWDKLTRRKLADEFEDASKRSSFIWTELANIAAQETWGRPYQFGDYLISGIASEEFREPMKNALRFWARRTGECMSVAYALRSVRG